MLTLSLYLAMWCMDSGWNDSFPINGQRTADDLHPDFLLIKCTIYITRV